MARHILVPLDGSPLAAAAIPYAVALARTDNARISLLAIVTPFPDHIGVPSAAAREEDERQVTISTAYLASIATTIRAHDLNATTVVRHGNPASAILGYAEEEACSLVVMSTHGRTGLDRVRTGSVAQHVLRHAAIPILVVRPGTERSTTGVAEITEITATLDGSSLAETALPSAAQLATALAIPLTLLQVIPNLASLAYGGWGDGYYNYYPADAEMAGADTGMVEAYLETMASRLRQPGLEVRIRAERGAAIRAEEIITAYLTAHPTGLAVMASHGRGGVLRWVLGSTAEGVLDQAPCPILVVRQHDSTPELVGVPTVTTRHTEKPSKRS